MPSVYLKTYGCQMNVRDSEHVAQSLIARGYSLASDEKEADIILLNTCSVRDMAEQKAAEKISNLKNLRARRPHLIFGLLGCMAQSRGRDLLDQLPDLDLVVGTQKFHAVPDLLDSLTAAQRTPTPRSRRLRLVNTDPEAESQNTIRDHLLAPHQTSAFVSIMQGCNMHCTFCIVPSTRGPERSRPLAEIVREVEGLIAQGIKEITLLGQIVNLYGRHEFPAVAGRSPFVQLLHAVAAVPGLARLRFTSPHPIGFRRDLIEAWRDLPPLCEHVHLPAQSGSNRILKQMHRTYTREKYLDLVQHIRTAVPNVTLTTDLIVGFPGETETDFQETRQLLIEAQFDQAFIFRYSPRRDTPAATLPDPIDEAEKMRRNQELLVTLDQIVYAKSRTMLGCETEILVEGPSKNNPLRYQGRTRGNHLVMIDANERWRGQLLPVRITETTGFTYYAEPILVGLAES